MRYLRNVPRRFKSGFREGTLTNLFLYSNMHNYHSQLLLYSILCNWIVVFFFEFRNRSCTQEEGRSRHCLSFWNFVVCWVWSYRIRLLFVVWGKSIRTTVFKASLLPFIFHKFCSIFTFQHDPKTFYCSVELRGTFSFGFKWFFFWEIQKPLT